MPFYLRIYLPIYLTYLTYLPTYLLTYLTYLTYQPLVCLPTHLPIYVTYLSLICLPIHLLDLHNLSTCRVLLPTYPPYLPTNLPTFYLTYLRYLYLSILPVSRMLPPFYSSPTSFSSTSTPPPSPPQLR